MEINNNETNTQQGREKRDKKEARLKTDELKKESEDTGSPVPHLEISTENEEHKEAKQ